MPRLTVLQLNDLHGYLEPHPEMVRGENGNYFPHTLNNTVVAPPRMLIAFLENNLNEDGSVRIPAPLRPYMGGKEVITPAK